MKRRSETAIRRIAVFKGRALCRQIHSLNESAVGKTSFTLGAPQRLICLTKRDALQ